ncbi:mediator of RNA polymerase II transcription subunit 13-like protein [Lates japonicus]|uniref:Mediator of RNA polymerase II transcription subunit 13-like protein n=1 Tax=Lates japonicus TaxID=270547 RepID=A0AAD3RMI0_LATJO|nr:mediator of RNA polymerase II transcription subunit 13-like protein [Lates japonicus]
MTLSDTRGPKQGPCTTCVRRWRKGRPPVIATLGPGAWQAVHGQHVSSGCECAVLSGRAAGAVPQPVLRAQSKRASAVAWARSPEPLPIPTFLVGCRCNFVVLVSFLGLPLLGDCLLDPFGSAGRQCLVVV